MFLCHLRIFILTKLVKEIKHDENLLLRYKRLYAHKTIEFMFLEILKCIYCFQVKVKNTNLKSNFYFFSDYYYLL